VADQEIFKREASNFVAPCVSPVVYTLSQMHIISYIRVLHGKRLLTKNKGEGVGRSHLSFESAKGMSCIE